MFWFRLAAPLTGAFVLAACGGGSDSTSFGGSGEVVMLALSSNTPVAGVTWAMQDGLADEVNTALRQAALRSLGAGAEVLRRPGSTTAGADTIWLIYAPGSTGVNQWDLLQRSASEVSDLPKVSDVMCASPQGNPVDCTLVWIRR